MEHVKRWFRKWNLDLTKEEVIEAINKTKHDPAKYTPSPFDGPYAPKDSADFNGKTFVFTGEGRKYSFRIEDTNYNVSIKASWKDEKYHNSDNYCEDVFAWSYQGTANVVMYGTVTSAWEHNLDTDEVALIYCDRNCPIWSN